MLLASLGLLGAGPLLAPALQAHFFVPRRPRALARRRGCCLAFAAAAAAAKDAQVTFFIFAFFFCVVTAALRLHPPRPLPSLAHSPGGPTSAAVEARRNRRGAPVQRVHVH